MSSLGKILGIGAGVMFVGVTAMEALGDSLEEEFQRQAEIEAGTNSLVDPALAGEAAASTNSFVAVEATPVASSMLEQAIFDAFPTSAPKSKESRKKASQAADFISYTINSEGYLCARPVEVQRADANHYGIRCVMYRDGRGAANYLINIRTNSVAEI